MSPAISSSIPSAESQASATRWSGSSSRSSAAARIVGERLGALGAGRGVDHRPHRRPRCRSARKPSTCAVATPRWSMLTSTPRYSAVAARRRRRSTRRTRRALGVGDLEQVDRARCRPVAGEDRDRAASPPNHGRTSRSKSTRPARPGPGPVRARAVDELAAEHRQPRRELGGASYWSVSGSRLTCSVGERVGGDQLRGVVGRRAARRRRGTRRAGSGPRPANSTRTSDDDRRARRRAGAARSPRARARTGVPRDRRRTRPRRESRSRSRADARRGGRVADGASGRRTAALIPRSRALAARWRLGTKSITSGTPSSP